MSKVPYKGIIAVGSSKSKAVDAYREVLDRIDMQVYTDQEGTFAFASTSGSYFNPKNGRLGIIKKPALCSKVPMKSTASADVEANYTVCSNSCKSHIIYDSNNLLSFCPVCASSMEDLSDAEIEAFSADDTEIEDKPEIDISDDSTPVEELNLDMEAADDGFALNLSKIPLEDEEISESDDEDEGSIEDDEVETGDDEVEIGDDDTETDDSETDDSELSDDEIDMMAEDEDEEEDLDDLIDETDENTHDLEVVSLDDNLDGIEDKTDTTVDLSGDSTTSLVATASTVRKAAYRYKALLCGETVSRHRDIVNGFTVFASASDDVQYNPQNGQETMMEEPVSGESFVQEATGKVLAHLTKCSSAKCGLYSVSSKQLTNCVLCGSDLEEPEEIENAPLLMDEEAEEHNEEHTFLDDNEEEKSDNDIQIVDGESDSGECCESESDVADIEPFEELSSEDVVICSDTKKKVVDLFKATVSGKNKVLRYEDLVDGSTFFSESSAKFNPKSGRHILDGSKDSKNVRCKTENVEAHLMKCTSSACGKYSLSTNTVNFCVSCGSDLKEPRMESQPVISQAAVEPPTEELNKVEINLLKNQIVNSGQPTLDPTLLEVSYSGSINGERRWVAYYSGNPVAQATENTVSRRHAEIFGDKIFGEAVIAGARNSDVTSILDEMGFKPLTVTFDTNRQIEKEIDDRFHAKSSELELKYREEKNQFLSEHLDRLKAALATAAIGINRGFFKNVGGNPVKSSLWDIMSSVGISEPEVLIDNAFRENGEIYNNMVIQKAFEIMEKPLEVQNELAQVVCSSEYMSVSRSSRTLEDSLSNFGNKIESVSASPVEDTYSDRLKNVVSRLGKR